MANELPRVQLWLESQLASVNAPGGVWYGIAPAITATPYIILQFQGPVMGGDIAGVAGIRLWTSGLWQVKGMAPGSSVAALVTLADAIDAALQRQRGAAGTDGLVISCVRAQPLWLPELHPDGAVWTQLGGLYQIEARVN